MGPQDIVFTFKLQRTVFVNPPCGDGGLGQRPGWPGPFSSPAHADVSPALRTDDQARDQRCPFDRCRAQSRWLPRPSRLPALGFRPLARKNTPVPDR